MTLIIEDDLGRDRKVFENVTFIPRKGENINWSYYPTPKVIKVLYDYEDNKVYVTIS